MEGESVGVLNGTGVGGLEGEGVGVSDGIDVGGLEGEDVGVSDGTKVGGLEGCKVGTEKLLPTIPDGTELGGQVGGERPHPPQFPYPRLGEEEQVGD